MQWWGVFSLGSVVIGLIQANRVNTLTQFQHSVGVLTKTAVDRDHSRSTSVRAPIPDCTFELALQPPQPRQPSLKHVKSHNKSAPPASRPVHVQGHSVDALPSCAKDKNKKEDRLQAKIAKYLKATHCDIVTPNELKRFLSELKQSAIERTEDKENAGEVVVFLLAK